MSMPKSKFPMIHNEGKALVKDGKVTFTYFDSHGQPHTPTWAVLSPSEIIDRTRKRLARFKSMPPGTRESEESRTERKWISAHPISILRRAWDRMSEPNRMEFAMMLAMESHHGISDPKFAEEQKRRLKSVSGDDGRTL